MAVTIRDVWARQVYDSRGYPTVEALITLSGGAEGRFITPSGASLGKKEALELRDKDEHKFQGKGVLKAIDNIKNIIRKALLGKTFLNAHDFDNFLIELDGTKNKSHLGANAILPVSGAFFHAWAYNFGHPLYSFNNTEAHILPMPLVNVINGGAHADNNLDIQEFMIVPIGASNFADSMAMVAEVFLSLKSLLKNANFSTTVGDEGGFAPQLKNNEHALDLLLEAINKAGFTTNTHFALALDVAANEIFDEARKLYLVDNNSLTSEELLDWYEDLITKYPICSIEDPFAEDDITSFQAMTKKLGKRLQIVGDDLFVTNQELIRVGIENHYANAVLIKVNQIGTITEAIDATRLTQDAGLAAIISHRSGDTEDTTIADLAVLTNAGQIKTGSLSRSERVAKYNRLLRIEEELGDLAQFHNAFLTKCESK